MLRKKKKLVITDATGIGRVIESTLKKDSILFMLDVDGTLEEADSYMLSVIERYKAESANDPVYLLITTGKTVVERRENTKYLGKKTLANCVDLIVGQGGSVVDTGDSLIVVPVKNSYVEKVITTLSDILGSEADVFRNEHLCLHYVSEDNEEVVSIPIYREDEEEIKEILSTVDEDIVTAYEKGLLNGRYSLAIEEYLERGMPSHCIGVSYQSEFEKLVITELTVVGSPEIMDAFKKSMNSSVRIQQSMTDRKKGTRGSSEGVHPSIADITAISKMDVLRNIRHSGGTIGLGDQFNDNFLFDVDVAFVANAAPIGMDGGWDFACSMAEYAKEHPEKTIIHAEKFGDGKQINWVLNLLLSFGSNAYKLKYAKDLSTCYRNIAMREYLIDMKKEK